MNKFNATLLSFVGIVAILSKVNAECPNACSGHGTCGNFDMCNCWRNWQANDCSERICPFGLAHVDTPKGDLDMSNTVDNPASSKKVAYHPQYYSAGTDEKYPYMANVGDSAYTAVYSNTGHYYMECSNKGLCDRDSGECECFEGYEGSACQRASCPNQCSGHGTCETIRELAAKDYGNIYELWDRDATMGCDCDPGYYGADCSLRYCKYGIDPLYFDDEATYRTNAWNIHFDGTAGSASANPTGTFAIKFYDVFDEDYMTKPIVFNEGDTTTVFTESVKGALAGLPNTVVPDLVISSTKAGIDKYVQMTFTKNPGAAKAPEVNMYLNGNYGAESATLPSNGFKVGNGATDSSEMAVTVQTGGISGEFRDYFYKRCEGFTVTVKDHATAWGSADKFIGAAGALVIDTTAKDGGSDIKNLKRCLGDSNGETSDNSGVENWDTGSETYQIGASDTGYAIGQYPHAIKLVEENAADTKGGVFYLAFHTVNTDESSPADDSFKLASRFYKGDGATTSTKFHVYTTDVVTKMVYVSEVASAYAFVGAVSEFRGGFSVKNTANKPLAGAAATFKASPVYARWTKDTDIVYTNFDTSCERMRVNGGYGQTAPQAEYIYPCLQKGDYIFIPDGNWGSDFKDNTSPTPADSAYDTTTGSGKQTALMSVSSLKRAEDEAAVQYASGSANSKLDYTNHMFQIKKIWTAPYESTTGTTENRYRIQVDKPLSYTADVWADLTPTNGALYTTALGHLAPKQNDGVFPIFKFDVDNTHEAGVTENDGNAPTYFEYVSECSNKGLCNAESGVCECFKGYTGDDCAIQNSFAS